jgi:hypothetical protein
MAGIGRQAISGEKAKEAPVSNWAGQLRPRGTVPFFFFQLIFFSIQIQL